MWKKIVLSLLLFIVTLGTLGTIKGLQIGAMIASAESFVPPPEAVSTTVVEEKVWEPTLSAVGTVVAARGVTVSSEVPGLVTALRFESGQKVRRGAVLVQLDKSIELAQLSSAEATAELAEASLRRARGLSQEKINAPAELDSAKASARQARAQVENIRAQIAKKTIRAPFSGTLGIRQVELGQIVAPGTPIATLQDLDEVYVDFFLPQHDLSLIAPGQAVRVTSDGGQERVTTGKIQAIEPSVDVATRNVRVRGLFKNKEGFLRPGMFVEAEVLLPPGPPVIVIPYSAVLYAPYGNSVYVVEPGSEGSEGMVARQVFIEIGERRGDFVAITSGLKKDQTVVSAGAFKLRNGMSVVIDNSEPLDPQLAPTPKDT